MLVYYLLLACFARIIYTLNTKDDIKPQNFRTYSERSVSVHAGWVAKSKVLVPVLTAFLLILDHRFEEYDKGGSFPLVKGSIHLGNSFFFSLSGKVVLQTGCRVELIQPQIQKRVPHRTSQKGKMRKGPRGRINIFWRGFEDYIRAIKLLIFGQTLSEICLCNFY